MGKDVRIAVRVTAKEKEKIQAKARKCGLSTSEYVKQRALGYEPRAVPPDALFACLEKLGELADSPVLRVVYFLISFAALTLGIALSNHCKLPIIPTDLFPRELAVILNKPYKTVKTRFDLGCLTVTVVLSLLFLHGIRGIGIGTVFCALVMGRCIFWVGERLTRHFVFVSFLAPHPEQDP